MNRVVDLAIRRQSRPGQIRGLGGRSICNTSQCGPLGHSDHVLKSPCLLLFTHPSCGLYIALETLYSQHSLLLIETRLEELMSRKALFSWPRN
jgi:hypothetical protein